MPPLRQPLQAALDALNDMVDELAADYPDEGDFWAAFAGEADLIEDSATDAHEIREVRRRIDAMIQRAGIPWV